MNSARYIKIALFFLVLGGAGTTYMVLSSDGLAGFKTRTYEAILQDASGLSTRSKVYLAGVPVGQVQDIQLHGTEAHLKIGLLKNVEIRQNAAISRKASSLLGTTVLSLDPGTELTPIIPPGGRINNAPVKGDIDSALGIMQDVGGQINLLLEEFRTNQLALFAVSLETFNSIAKKIDDQSEAQLDRISRILESAALITERTKEFCEAEKAT